VPHRLADISVSGSYSSVSNCAGAGGRTARARADCGWRGEPGVIDERDEAEIEDLITQEGWKEDGCVIPTVPLMELVKPGGRKG
jgi:hypothetical protein